MARVNILKQVKTANGWRNIALRRDARNHAVNYVDFYDDERLLFEKVGPEFQRGIDPSVITSKRSWLGNRIGLVTRTGCA